MYSAISPKSIWAPLTGTISATRLRVDDNGTVTWNRSVQYGWALQSLTIPAVVEVRDQDNNVTTPAADAIYTDIPSCRGTLEMDPTAYMAWPDGVTDNAYILGYTATKIGVTLTS